MRLAAGLGLASVAGALAAGMFAVGYWARPTLDAARKPAAAKTFVPPPVSAIPNTPFGREVALGRAIFVDPAHQAPQFVGNSLRCSNCHLGEGRLAHSAPMWAAWVGYPAYRAKTGAVDDFAERLRGCFMYSMNGKAPPPGDKVLVALESYAYFLAKGAPTGERMPGAGYPKLPAPPLKPDFGRGQKVYAQNCALCHGADGAGQASGGAPVFPALWGPDSFNWGAGMADSKTAAGFIQANMPLGKGGSLSLQDAWDVATYVDGQPRPQDPRFTGNVAETRAKYHHSKTSMYGLTVNGILLGSGPRTDKGR